MTERSDVFAYFWVKASNCSVAAITAQLQTEPTEVTVIGASRSDDFPKINLWRLLSPMPRGDGFLQDHIDALLVRLEMRADAVVDLGANCEMGISCVGYYYGTNPGFHLSATLIQRLAALRLAVDFDLYNFAGEEAL